jgi:DNA processing protein
MRLSMHSARGQERRGRPKTRYRSPRVTASISLGELVRSTGRSALLPQQYTLLTGRREDPDAPVLYAGSIDLLKRPAVSIVGTREVTEEGRSRARRLACLGGTKITGQPKWSKP